MVIDSKVCEDNECIKNSNAVFDVYDKNGKLVQTFKTDTNGIGQLMLGYGRYTIKQISGIAGYELVDNISLTIDSYTDNYYFSVEGDYIVPDEDRKENDLEQVINYDNSNFNEVSEDVCKNEKNSTLIKVNNSEDVKKDDINDLIIENPNTGSFINSRLLLFLLMLSLLINLFVKNKRTV